MDTNTIGMGDAHLVEAEPQVPDWLTAPVPKRTHPNRALMRELTDLEYQAMFEPVLDQIAQGTALTEILRSDHRDTDCAKFMRWIHKDPMRKSRYYEAQEIGAELIASSMIAIADAEDSVEDVQRSKLRIDTRRFLLGVWNKRRYGEVKQIEVGGSISITEALAQAQRRVIEGEIIDVTSRDAD